MSFSRTIAAMLSVFLLLAPSLSAQQPTSSAPAATPQWVQRSDQDAQVLLKVLARFNPEIAARFGVPGIDEQVVDLQPGYLERERQALRQAQTQLEGMLADEKDPAVRQDLQIMIKRAKQQARESELEEKYELLYVNLPQLVFLGMRGLLDEQIAPERRPAALVRLRKYVGMEPGTTSIVQLTEERYRERLKPGLMGRSKARC